jgi:hypothetical protein
MLGFPGEVQGFSIPMRECCSEPSRQTPSRIDASNACEASLALDRLDSWDLDSWDWSLVDRRLSDRSVDESKFVRRQEGVR